MESADRDGMTRLSSDVKFILVSVILTAIMGAKTISSIVKEDEGLVQESSFSRKVASLSEDVVKPMKTKEATRLRSYLLSLNLDCSKSESAAVNVSSPYVQLTGKKCGVEAKAKKISIINKSNGFTASIFFPKSGEYQTDLIQLQNGPNKILIEYVNSSGQSFRQELNVLSNSI